MGRKLRRRAKLPLLLFVPRQFVHSVPLHLLSFCCSPDPLLERNRRRKQPRRTRFYRRLTFELKLFLSLFGPILSIFFSDERFLGIFNRSRHVFSFDLVRSWPHFIPHIPHFLQYYYQRGHKGTTKVLLYVLIRRIILGLLGHSPPARRFQPLRPRLLLQELPRRALRPVADANPLRTLRHG